MYERMEQGEVEIYFHLIFIVIFLLKCEKHCSYKTLFKVLIYYYKKFLLFFITRIQNLLKIIREGVRNLILVYPTLIHKFFGTFFGEIHRVNPEILVYPRIHWIHL